MLTDGSNSATYARRFPCQPPPIPKMMGGIFIPVTTEELCQHWESYSPQPLLILYNGHSHYDSTANKDKSHYCIYNIIHLCINHYIV